MSNSDDPQIAIHALAEEMTAMDPREARARIEEAFPQGSDTQDGDAPAGEVVDMDGDPHTVDEDGREENPFAKEASAVSTARMIEALLFASPEPLSLEAIAERVPGANKDHLLRVQSFYANRGVQLREVASKWQFVTAPDVAHVLTAYRTQTRKLSRAALETLAIIAYHQPCSRADIEEVRGVAVAKGSLDQLMELGWIRLCGRREVPGRPVLYGTTPSFLEHFSLGEIEDLPGMSDLKAQGLLDARLPPGFSVPKPSSGDGDEIDLGDGEVDTGETEFAAEFQGADDADIADDLEADLASDPEDEE